MRAMKLNRAKTVKLLNLNNIKLRYKMMIIYFFCVLMPIMLTNAVFYQVITNNVKNQRIKDITRALEQVKNEFQMEIDNAVKVSLVFCTDYVLNEILESEYQSQLEYITAYDSYLRKILNNFIPSYTSMQNIKIYLNNPTILFAGGTGYLSDEIRNSDWYKALKAAEEKGYSVVLTRTKPEASYRSDDDRDAFVIVRRLNYFDFFSESKWEKIIKIELRGNAIAQIFSNLNINGYVYLLNESDQIEYTTDPKKDWRTKVVFFKDVDIPEDSIKLVTYTNRNYLNNWKLVSIIPQSEIIKEVRNSRQFIFWLALLNLFYCTAIIIRITHSMNARLANILRYMEKAKRQQFEPIEGSETCDEIGELQTEFNRMILQIKSLINDVYIADIRRKNLEIENFKAQLNALQSQINLHYLFNTLETIRMRSTIKNETETAKIIYNLAKLLRSSLTWSNSYITVKEELEFINCFLEVQKYRFGDRLNYDIEAEPAVLDLTIPKMVFLPFVENASIHGIEPMKHGGNINIDFRLDGNYLRFSVRDNGVGMTFEQVERIKQYLDQEEELGERVGIHNVIRRLKLLYGDKFMIAIDSKWGEGTLVRIAIPVETDPEVMNTLSYNPQKSFDVKKS